METLPNKKNSKFKWILFFIALAIVVYIFSIKHTKEQKITSTPDSNSSINEIKEKGELRVGMDVNFMPFEMKNSKGEIFGFDAEMMKEFSQFLGVQVKFIETPWVSIINDLLADKIDMIASGLSITEKRKEIMLFSNSYFLAPVGALTTKSNPAGIVDAHDIKKGKTRVAVRSGTTIDFHFTELGGYNVIRFPSSSTAITAVLQNKADIFIQDQTYLEVFQHTNKNNKNFIIIRNFLPAEQFGVAAAPKKEDLIAEFNKFLISWQSSNEWREAFKTYFLSFDWLSKQKLNDIQK